MTRVPVLERALALAASGQFRARWQVAKALEREGYTIAEVGQLELSSINRQITAACRAAQAGVVSRSRYAA